MTTDDMATRSTATRAGTCIPVIRHRIRLVLNCGGKGSWRAIQLDGLRRSVADHDAPPHQVIQERL